MEYCIYKFNFKTAVHIGSGKLSDGEMTFHADTLFSALCQEALQIGGEDMLQELISYVEKDQLRISDCFPFVQKNHYYIPKPMKAVSHEQDSSTDRKAFKKLKYLPVEKLEEYLDGTLDVVQENAVFAAHSGVYSVKISAAISEIEDTKPYSIGLWSFPQDSGLYFILGYESDEVNYFVGDLMGVPPAVSSPGCNNLRQGYNQFRFPLFLVSIRSCSLPPVEAGSSGTNSITSVISQFRVSQIRANVSMLMCFPSLLMLAIIFVVIPAASLKSSFLISRSNSVCQSGL